MKEPLQSLLNLQTLEFSEVENAQTEKQAAELRAKVPPPILAHYDRLRERGKKGLAPVRNQVCTGCHMQVPRALVITLMHETDIQVCENCGRYLYLPEEKEPEPEISSSPMTGKVSVKSRRRKELVHAV
jgi:predicted  nucleic acid-binding Zn-ribbon protein